MVEKSKSKQTTWVVTRYRFDKNEKQFRYDGYHFFKGDTALLNFIRNVMAKASNDFRWSITYVVEDEEACENR